MNAGDSQFSLTKEFYSSLFSRKIQRVRKVSLQFQKFITQASEKTDKWKLLQNETYIFKFSLPLYGHHWTLSKPKNKFESLGHRNPLQVQGVHKVSLQFQKFITKANEKIGK